MDMKNFFFIITLACGSFNSIAQHHIKTDYPKDYFRNPLDIPIILAGNFGECRPNHFHGGLDIKTEGKENLPVHAAADGFISRVKIEKGGYGHAIYIEHPNGYTTVYAHLNDFMPEVQKYVKKEQYNTENWRVDLRFYATDFPVKKGDIIAYSGNTGASTAPHLHFEIRGTEDEHSLNPQLFGFDIKDNIPPKPTKLVVYDILQPVYVQKPRIIELQKKGDIYLADTIKVVSDQTGIGLVMNDYMNGSDNTLTYYTARMYMSDALTVTIRMNYIGHHDTRYLNAYADYKLKYETGDWVQCLFQQDGNMLEHIYEYDSEYRRLTQKGKLELAVNQIKKVRIELKDANDNTTEIQFYIHRIQQQYTPPSPCSNKFIFSRPNNFSNGQVALIMEDYSLYENMCFEFASKPDADNYSDRLQIHHPYVPVHKDYNLYINTNKPVPDNLRDKIALIYSDGKDETGKAAEPNDGWYKATVRKFGTYWLAADTIAPEIKPLQKDGANLSKANIISFDVKEQITSVASFRAELDGKWLAFEQSGSNFSYKFDEHCPKGKHKLEITAADENGNKKSLVYNFTR